MAICPAAPNSFHTVMLEDEVEMTQHANPTISTRLTRSTTPPSQKCVSQARTPLVLALGRQHAKPQMTPKAFPHSVLTVAQSLG